MIHPHIISAIRAGRLQTITRTEWHEVADALTVGLAPADAGPAHILGTEVMALRERLVSAEQRCAELAARIQRAESALRGDPA